MTAAKRQKLPKILRYMATVKVCCKAVGMEMPFPEYRFAAPRLFRFDFCWPDWKVALEVDGGIWTQGRHSRGSGLLREHEKMNLAASLGYRIFRCTPQTVGDLTLYRMIRGALS